MTEEQKKFFRTLNKFTVITSYAVEDKEVRNLSDEEIESLQNAVEYLKELGELKYS